MYSKLGINKVFQSVLSVNLAYVRLGMLGQLCQVRLSQVCQVRLGQVSYVELAMLGYLGSVHILRQQIFGNFKPPPPPLVSKRQHQRKPPLMLTSASTIPPPPLGEINGFIKKWYFKCLGSIGTRYMDSIMISI